MNKEDLVRIKDIIPDIYVSLPYATATNFTGEPLYDFNEAYLRRGTAEKLKAAQNEVMKHGFSLLVLDAYRPAAAQWKMWRILPDDDFVANPERGYSRHTRGCAVDVSLVTAEGAAVAMPSDFDDFTGKAKRDYTSLDEKTKHNIAVLENAMKTAGFNAYINEWWHFNDTESYEVLENFTE